MADLDDLHDELDRERARFEQQVRRRLAVVLSNEVGLARLRAITDEEWAEAVLAGEPAEEEELAS